MAIHTNGNSLRAIAYSRDKHTEFVIIKRNYSSQSIALLIKYYQTINTSDACDRLYNPLVKTKKTKTIIKIINRLHSAQLGNLEALANDCIYLEIAIIQIKLKNMKRGYFLPLLHLHLLIQTGH